MKWLAAALSVVLLMLQYRLWLSNDGVREVLRLKAAVAAQEQQNAGLTERNRELAAEVHDLKQGYAALEERARADLGMIAGNETFYQVVPRVSAGAPGMPADGASPAPGADRSPQAAAQAVPRIAAAVRAAH